MSTRRVLIADDDKNIRLTLSSLLEEMGFEVETVSGGWQAVYAARRPHDAGPFWLAFVDFKMPGIDGVEVVYNIRKDVPQTHLVLITAQGTFKMAAQATEHGAERLLSKPFTPTDVRTLVREIETHDAQIADAATEPAGD